MHLNHCKVQKFHIENYTFVSPSSLPSPIEKHLSDIYYGNILTSSITPTIKIRDFRYHIISQTLGKHLRESNWFSQDKYIVKKHTNAPETEVLYELITAIENQKNPFGVPVLNISQENIITAVWHINVPSLSFETSSHDCKPIYCKHRCDHHFPRSNVLS